MNEQEYMDKILKSVKKMSDHRQREILAEKDNQSRLSELVSDINTIFKKHGIMEEVNKGMVKFNADFIGNILDISDKKLSNIIFDHYFPKPNKGTYYHYTSFRNAESIVKSGKLKLYNLNKRFTDGEFVTFYDEHGMEGHKKGEVVLGIDTSGKGIMSDIFYISLTRSKSGELNNSLWKDFGEDGEGVRLEFLITTKTDDFREVYYSKNHDDKNIPLLKDLLGSIKAKYGKPFNFTYSSKIGAFYIKGKFRNENEFRFVIKRTSDDYGAYHLNPTMTDSLNSIGFIEVPFSNDYAEFELKTIQLGYRCTDSDRKEAEHWIQNFVTKPIIFENDRTKEF
jgi:hypothetical protein